MNVSQVFQVIDHLLFRLAPHASNYEYRTAVTRWASSCQRIRRDLESVLLIIDFQGCLQPSYTAAEYLMIGGRRPTLPPAQGKDLKIGVAEDKIRWTSTSNLIATGSLRSDIAAFKSF